MNTAIDQKPPIRKLDLVVGATIAFFVVVGLASLDAAAKYATSKLNQATAVTTSQSAADQQVAKK